MNVRPEVRQAREYVLNTYTPDILGLRGSQWDPSTQVCTSTLAHSKFTPVTSDETLANVLPASALNPKDARSASMLPGRREQFDARHRYHAFDRGDATADWDFTTSMGQRELRAWQQRLDTTCRTATKRKTDKLLSNSATGYTPLQAREGRATAGQRKQKEQADAQHAELVRKYGEEGAQMMSQILAMKQRTKWRPLKTTWDDLAAVQQLPEVVWEGQPQAPADEA